MADHVFPEDAGTGAAEGDWNDAANFGQLVAAAGHTDVVASGLDFTYYSGDDSLDIGQGVAVLTASGVTATNSGDTRDTVAFAVDADARSGFSLSSNAINYIFIRVDLSADDSISYAIRAQDDAPAEPSLKIGTVDTNNGTTTELNRAPTPLAIEDTGTTVADASTVDFGANLDASDDGDGHVTVTASDVGSDDMTARKLVQSPNASLMNVSLADTDSAEVSHPVPNGDTLEVFLWGGYQISDGTAPSGLNVQLKDGGDTVQASANTVRDASTDSASPVASHQNSSGSASVFKLAVANATGSEISDPGVGAVFGYRVI